MKKKWYIHYGADKFDLNEFKEVKNRERPWIKPEAHTGFWASPVNAENGWKKWCESENYEGCDLSKFFRFKVKHPDRIFLVNNKISYSYFVSHYGIKNSSIVDDYEPRFFDFEKMIRDGWAGLEVSITDFPGLYQLMYGWDCDSIIIFDPSEIVFEETPYEYAERRRKYWIRKYNEEHKRANRLNELYLSVSKELDKANKIISILQNDLFNEESANRAFRRRIKQLSKIISDNIPRAKW